MAIDWGALLPAHQTAAPVPGRPAVQTHVTGTNGSDAGSGIDAGAGSDDDCDREAWEERAAIIEFDGGQDRRTAEALATTEQLKRRRASAWAARGDDDRRYCPECQRYQDRRCTIARPGGLVSAVRGYTPVPNILRRCEGFAPKPDDPDQRPGVRRWPWLLPSFDSPASSGVLAPWQPVQSPSGLVSA